MIFHDARGSSKAGDYLFLGLSFSSVGVAGAGMSDGSAGGISSGRGAGAFDGVAGRRRQAEPSLRRHDLGDLAGDLVRRWCTVIGEGKLDEGGVADIVHGIAQHLQDHFVANILDVYQPELLIDGVGPLTTVDLCRIESEPII